MKYEKGSFIVVPNIQQLKGQPSELQSVFFWICQHADKDGECFPSRQLLAKESGTGLRRIDKYISQLIELGLIKKFARPRTSSRQPTNLYQIQILEEDFRVAKNASESSQIGKVEDSQKVVVTIPIVNYTHLTNTISQADVVSLKKTKKQLRKELPYTYESELQWLWDEGWKGNKIIHNYMQRKKFNFENREQFNAEVGQCKPWANKLLGYTSKQINDTMDYCANTSKNFTWKLSTVAKNISEVINKK